MENCFKISLKNAKILDLVNFEKPEILSCVEFQAFKIAQIFIWDISEE